MPEQQTIDTHNKALKINLDPRWYGTFAEIGAGQEVVRWFFRVGGAAGTIAKSISAYDMKVSDAIYGQSERYVSRGRLQAMLEHEYKLNVERLESHSDNTAFFCFADTVVARSYRGGNECHGWMGIKFQSHPRDEPNQIVIQCSPTPGRTTATTTGRCTTGRSTVPCCSPRGTPPGGRSDPGRSHRRSLGPDVVVAPR